MAAATGALAATTLLPAMEPSSPGSPYLTRGMTAFLPLWDRGRDGRCQGVTRDLHVQGQLAAGVPGRGGQALRPAVLVRDHRRRSARAQRIAHQVQVIAADQRLRTGLKPAQAD